MTLSQAEWKHEERCAMIEQKEKEAEAQEQLCRLIELDHEEILLEENLSDVRSERKMLAQDLMEAHAVDWQSVFVYRGQAYYLEADFEEYTGISITPIRDLGRDNELVS